PSRSILFPYTTLFRSISYQATHFVQDLRTKIEHDFPNESTEISWDIQLGDATLNVDPQFFEEAFTELFTNALRHDRGKGPVLAKDRKSTRLNSSHDQI